MKAEVALSGRMRAVDALARWACAAFVQAFLELRIRDIEPPRIMTPEGSNNWRRELTWRANVVTDDPRPFRPVGERCALFSTREVFRDRYGKAEESDLLPLLR